MIFAPQSGIINFRRWFVGLAGMADMKESGCRARGRDHGEGHIICRSTEKGKEVE
jgi:hypothetical protein